MKKVIFYLLLIFVFGCSSGEDDIPELTADGHDVKYRVTNNIPDETITLIVIENDKGVINELEILKTGETSKDLISFGVKNGIGVICDFPFRTTFKSGNEAVSFFTTQKSGITV